MTKYVIDNSFKSLIKDILKNNKKLNNRYFKYHPNSKYKIDDILDDILYVLKTGISWRDIRSHINWNTLYQHFKGMIDEKIFFKLFKVLQKRYLKSNYINALIIDSSFIPNKYGRDKISRNKFYKNKKGNKISLITDINGIPLSVFVDRGTIHDIKLTYKHKKDLQFENNIILLADKGYISGDLRSNLQEKGIQLMTPRKKNQKKPNPFNKTLYKNRIKIENTFQKIKNSRRLSIRYDHLLNTYKTFVYISISLLLYKKLKV